MILGQILSSYYFSWAVAFGSSIILSPTRKSWGFSLSPPFPQVLLECPFHCHEILHCGFGGHLEWSNFAEPTFRNRDWGCKFSSCQNSSKEHCPYPILRHIVCCWNYGTSEVLATVVNCASQNKPEGFNSIITIITLRHQQQYCCHSHQRPHHVLWSLSPLNQLAKSIGSDVEKCGWVYEQHTSHDLSSSDGTEPDGCFSSVDFGFSKVVRGRLLVLVLLQCIRKIQVAGSLSFSSTFSC